MPNISIELFEGRSVDEKRELAAKVTDAVVDTLKVKREIVRIKFINLNKQDVARGGTLISDQS